MRRKSFKLGLSAILLFYSLLYIATTKVLPCDGICQKMEDVSLLVKQGRPYVYGSWRCRDSTLCISVKDTTQIDWNALADTACMHLKSQSLFNYTTVITNQRGDTLANKNCP